jgi:hypothetical protein
VCVCVCVCARGAVKSEMGDEDSGPGRTMPMDDGEDSACTKWIRSLSPLTGCTLLMPFLRVLVPVCLFDLVYTAESRSQSGGGRPCVSHPSSCRSGTSCHGSL